MSHGAEDNLLRRLMDRRRALAMLGALGAGAVAAACSKKSSTTTGASATPSAGTSSPLSGATGGATTNANCVLTPELTAGPYYIDIDNVRSDITEGSQGAPLKLAITVVDAKACSPIKDAAVDVWHADATGEYSGFGAAAGGPGGGPGGGNTPTNTKRFLRGTQLTDASGAATFRTVYPGWYPGRAVHIHMKVHTGGKVVHTGQLFFDDDFTAGVYRKTAPYSTRPTPDTLNSGDNIFGQAGGAGLVDIRADGSGYDAGITVGLEQA